MPSRLHSILGVSLAACLLAGAASQPLTPPPNSPRRADPTWHALRNVTLIPEPGVTMHAATVVFRDGVITAVLPGEAGPDGVVGTEDDVAAPLPLGPRVWDGTGLHVYAGFIDPFVEVDAPRPDAADPGAHWNARVSPQRSALAGPGLDERSRESLRRLGFAAAAIAPRGGIFRGESAVVSLARLPESAAEAKPTVYRAGAYQTVGFDLSGDSGGGWPGYPNSMMGAIALVRQTLLDADWQAEARAAGAEVPPNALDALARRHRAEPGAKAGEVASAPVLFFSVDDELDALRAVRILREFGRRGGLIGSGTEFARLRALAEACAEQPRTLAATIDDGGGAAIPVVLPLNFPRAPDVSSPGRADSVELRTLMLWEQAPTNPRRVEGAGLLAALTSSKLRDRAEFAENLGLALRAGLAPDRALAMLTTNPAAILGVGERLGTVAPAKAANLVVASGDLFTADGAKRGKIRDVWIDGARHEITPPPGIRIAGLWDLHLVPPTPDARTLTIGEDNSITVTKFWADAETNPAHARPATQKAERVVLDGRRLSFVFEHEPFGSPGIMLASAVVEGESMIGEIVYADGRRRGWHAERRPEEAKSDPKGSWRIVEIDGAPAAEADRFTLEIGAASATFTFPREGEEPTVVRVRNVKIEGPAASLSRALAPIGGEGEAAETWRVEGESLTGESIQPDGARRVYRAERHKRDEQPRDDQRFANIPEELGHPFGPYMMADLPEQPAVLRIVGATIWTVGPQGTIKDGEMVVEKDVITYIGPRRAAVRFAAEPVTIDATGKHITPGIIDCHSHTGISRGVNESGQAVTSEVRIQDVTNPDAINWYRQLAGGVTAVNSLHGSANPIGGQNAVNRVRWGVAHPDDMHFAGRETYRSANFLDPRAGARASGVMQGIKFALGENVKQSNRAERTTRYPATRMGVETIIRDRFIAAREYAAEWGRWAGDRKGPPPRRDLELEALAEILSGERLVHCHSYRQDEILMLARVAKEFGFRIGTYQHILEGYKVAEVVRDFSLGGSAFSDWWAYKVEVQDAIPQAGPIMHEQGAVVSYNSDSDELARRMNVEAGKALKYGNMSPEEALAFVTLNPARQLLIDGRVGSLEVGKDGDFAVWSGPPMSSMSRCEATYIEGRRFFSLEDDAAHRQRNNAERSRIIQKLLASPARGRARPAREAEEPSAIDQLRALYIDLRLRGFEPAYGTPGDCGCDDFHWLDRE